MRLGGRVDLLNIEALLKELEWLGGATVVSVDTITHMAVLTPTPQSRAGIRPVT